MVALVLVLPVLGTGADQDAPLLVDDWMEYAVRALPPLFAGAAHVSWTWEAPALAVPHVTASGGPVGVAAFDVADHVPVPLALMAATWKTYLRPLVSPVTVPSIAVLPVLAGPTPHVAPASTEALME